MHDVTTPYAEVPVGKEGDRPEGAQSGQSFGARFGRRLRVLHASPTWFSADSVMGGGERWVDNVVHALAAGAPFIEQSMVALGREPGLFRRAATPVRVLANRRGLSDAMGALSPDLWDEFASFDLIHVHQALTDFGAYACCVAATLGKTVVLTDLGGGSNPVMLNGGGLTLADGILSISRYAHAMTASGVRSPTIILVGPVDTEAFHPNPAGPPSTPAAICVSRILPHKGIDRILRALPPGLKLRVVGRVYHDEYRMLLGELAQGKNVEFIHDADDEALVGYYHASSLFLQASCMKDVYGNVATNTELMGLTTLEAMSCGLPVIVSADGGSLPELVTDPDFGRVFKDEVELERLLRRHQAGLWPPAGAHEAARRHAVGAVSHAEYGRRLGAFYAEVHAARCARAGIQEAIPCES